MLAVGTFLLGSIEDYHEVDRAKFKISELSFLVVVAKKRDTIAMITVQHYMRGSWLTGRCLIRTCNIKEWTPNISNPAAGLGPKALDCYFYSGMTLPWNRTRSGQSVPSWGQECCAGTCVHIQTDMPRQVPALMPTFGHGRISDRCLCFQILSAMLSNRR